VVDVYLKFRARGDCQNVVVYQSNAVGESHAVKESCGVGAEVEVDHVSYGRRYEGFDLRKPGMVAGEEEVVVGDV
jgi:hypothetical protein